MAGMVFGESSGGWLADKVGPKLPLLAGTLICAPLVLCFVFARGVTALFLIFLVWGVIRSAVFGPARGYIGNAVAVANKATLIAVFMASQSVARSLGSLASGYIADHLGYDWNFYVSASISILAGALIIVGLRGSPLWKRSFNSAAVPVLTNLTDNRPTNYRTFAIQCALPVLFLLGAGANSFLSLLATQVIGVDATQVGLLFTVSGVVNTLLLLPMGRLADRKSKKTLMIAGLILSGAAFAGIAFSHNFSQLILFTVVNSLGFVMFTPASVALLSNSVRGRWQGTAMGIYGAAEDLGIIIGSSAGGFLWSGPGPSSVFLMGSLSCIAGTLICVALIHEKSLTHQTVAV
jgi:MFS family permease